MEHMALVLRAGTGTCVDMAQRGNGAMQHDADATDTRYTDGQLLPCCPKRSTDAETEMDGNSHAARSARG